MNIPPFNAGRRLPEREVAWTLVPTSEIVGVVVAGYRILGEVRSLLARFESMRCHARKTLVFQTAATPVPEEISTWRARTGESLDVVEPSEHIELREVIESAIRSASEGDVVGILCTSEMSSSAMVFAADSLRRRQSAP
jgi:hypothetical protein